MHTIRVLLLGFAAFPALAAPPDCGNVLLDTSRTLQERRVLAAQCQRSACMQEARELQLAPQAESRYLAMCTEDLFDEVASASAASADTAHVSARDCLASEACKDLDAALEPTAAGMSAGRRSDGGHTFVRVPRINEVIER